MKTSKENKSETKKENTNTYNTSLLVANAKKQTLKKASNFKESIYTPDCSNNGCRNKTRDAVNKLIEENENFILNYDKSKDLEKLEKLTIKYLADIQDSQKRNIWYKGFDINKFRTLRTAKIKMFVDLLN